VSKTMRSRAQAISVAMGVIVTAVVWWASVAQAAPPSGSITKSGSNYNLDFMSDPTFGLNLKLTNAKVTAVSSSPGNGCGVNTDGSLNCSFPTKQTAGQVVFTTDKDPCTGPATLKTDSGSASVNCGSTPTPTTSPPPTTTPPPPPPVQFHQPPINPAAGTVIVGGPVETGGSHIEVTVGGPSERGSGDNSSHTGVNVGLSESGGAGRVVGVYLHSDPVLLGIVVLDSNGRASFVAPIPPGTPPGWHEIIAVDFFNGLFGSAPVFIGGVPGGIPGLPDWLNAYVAPAFGWGAPAQTSPAWSNWGTPTWGAPTWGSPSWGSPSWGSSGGQQQQQQQSDDSGSVSQQQQQQS
jgi:hypothetical protein